MPLDRRAALQLGLLLLVVPAQYIISHLMASSESQRSFAIKNLVSDALGFRNRYLSLKSWKKWCTELLKSFTPSDDREFSGKDDPMGESPAVEVINFKDPKGYFAGSTEPRTTRPPSIKFRVGQVVRHKLWRYRGVIVGWDPQARAPEAWLQQMHPPDMPHWREMPNYAILVDTRDRLSPQTTYVPQENLDIIVNTPIIHPSTDDYFEKFDGAQYLPRPWLKAMYPEDS